MTPLRLELGGFTVFRETTVIELEGLELFAISGPTGSGKSTLLDALTYALYGQTARIGSKGLDVLISPGLAQLFVTLEFRNARGTYRVTRTADRKPSGAVLRNTRIEALGQDAKWTQLPESEKLKDADAKLEELIGLDYDGFTRSVLLPQGAFDEFLKGDTGKRRKLLVNLLGLDRVETMQKEAGRRARDAETLAKSITERLEQDYAGATPERRRELKKTLDDLAARKLEVTERQTELTAMLKELDEVKVLWEERVQVEKTLAALKAKAGEMSDKRTRLELAKRAQLIAPQLTGLEALRLKVTGAESDLTKLSTTLAAQQKELHSRQTERDTAQAAAEAQLPALDAKLDALAGVAPLVAQLKARGGTLELATEARGDLSYSDEAWDALRQREAQLPQLKGAEKAVADAERDLKGLQKTLEAFRKDALSFKRELGDTLAAGKKAKVALDEAKAAYEHAVLSDRAGALREHLHVGEACPVCEQTVQVLPPSSESKAAALKAVVDAAEQRRGELLETYQTVKAKADTTQNRIEDTEATVIKAAKRFEGAETQAAQLKQRLGVAGATEALERSLAEHKRALLAALAAHIHAQTNGADPDAAQRTAKTQRRQLEAALKTAESAYQTARSAWERLTTQHEERAKGLRDLKTSLGEAEASLTSALKTAQFETLEAARAALLREAHMSALEAELTSFQSQQEGAERRDVELQAKLAGRSLDAEHYAGLKTEQADLADALAEVQTEWGKTQGALHHVEVQLERAQDLRRQLTEQQHIYDTYRLLNLDLRGNEFQEYLLSQVQAKLARRASHIIREVTDGRYDLRLEDGDYVVRDAWTTGELRNAKTLSGGETFIASLALALALSDTVAGSHALGALFLDEGFGTLDADTLNSVAEVLENLTREGRMVGVITHVRDLTERLPARLSVRKGVEGSTVSWDL